MSVPDYRAQSKAFFDIKNPKYNFEHKEDCGKYTEEFVVYFRDVIGDKNIFHLRKYGAATQYNGHAIDAVLYFDPERGTYQSVDLIGSAEGPDVNASGTWTVQQVYYEAKDAYLIGNEPPVTEPTEFPEYEADFGGDKYATESIGNPLEADYRKAGQSLNAGSATWFARTYYDAVYFTVVDKMNPTDAMNKSVAKRQPEWRKALDPTGVIWK